MGKLEEIRDTIVDIAKSEAGDLWNPADADFWKSRAQEIAEIRVKWLLASDSEKSALLHESEIVETELKFKIASTVLASSEAAKNIATRVLSVALKILVSSM